MLDADRTAIFDLVDRTNVGEDTYTEILNLNLAHDTDYWVSVIGQYKKKQALKRCYGIIDLQIIQHICEKLKLQAQLYSSFFYLLFINYSVLPYIVFYTLTCQM